jgi:hypothetical protein
MFQRRTAIAAVLAGGVSVAGGVFAQSPSQPVVGISTVTTYSADVRITAVDPNARTVTFTFANGATTTRKISPSLASFNAARVGDAVSVAFEDRLTFVLSGPNAGRARRTRRQRCGGRAGRPERRRCGGR